MQADYLFVYGTLRRQGGSPWHDFIATHCEYAGEAHFQGRLYMLKGYPGLVCSDQPQDKVLGELYRLPPADAAFAAAEVLNTLDEYEECSAHFPHPHEYLREVHPVTTRQQTRLSAWVYIYNRSTDDSARIVSGDFLKGR